MNRQSPHIVHVLTLGGTISAQSAGRSGYDAAVGGDELVKGIAVRNVTVHVEEFSRQLSFAVSFEQIGQLVTRLDALLAEAETAGAVVTQGTAALEEVATLCDLTLQSDKPVVFTGATYPASDPGSDGPHNIYDAIRVASAEESTGRGSLVVFAGGIYAALEAQKLHKYSPAAFTSPIGPLGMVDAGGVIYYRRPRRRVKVPFPPLPAPRVEVIKAVVDMDDLLLRAAIDGGAAGIVLEGLPGSGGVPPSLLPAVGEALAAGVTVVLTSRSPFGRITAVAAGQSGPKVLEEMGVIVGGDLPAAKARLLLMAAVGSGKTRSEIDALFQEAGRPGRIA